MGDRYNLKYIYNYINKWIFVSFHVPIFVSVHVEKQLLP